MRISDWSSDVCSSDLARLAEPGSEITVATLAQDETIRRESTPEKLASLKRVFREDGRVSAGNASQICDGAAAVLLMRADKARELGLRPRAAIRGIVTVGSDPELMLTGPIGATRKLLARAGLTIEIGRASCRARGCQYV